MATAKYQSIADDLRDRLSTGTLPLEDDGRGETSKLPGEKELASEYGASRSTIRLALQVLVNQGLLETRHGLGTYLKDKPAPRIVLLDQQEDWRHGEHADAALKPAGPQNGAQTTARFQAETVRATGDVAVALALAEGDQVILRRSRQHIDGKPWCLVVSYYPMDVARGTELEKTRILAESSTQLLAELDHAVIRYTNSISARMPDAIELGFFRTTGVVPVIVISRIAFDDHGPVRLTRYIYPGDQVRIVHDQSAR